MAFAQHLVDCVNGPLAVAGRPAGTHRRGSPGPSGSPRVCPAGRGSEHAVAARLPAGKTLCLTGQVVDRVSQRLQPSAEAARIDGIAARGLRPCGDGLRIAVEKVDDARYAAGASAHRRGIKPLQRIEQREGGNAVFCPAFKLRSACWRARSSVPPLSFADARWRAPGAGGGFRPGAGTPARPRLT
jgi:hypothetical protein